MSFPSFTKEFHRDTYPAINTTRPELSAARKVVFITGGGQGIGAAIAKAFSQAEAADIIITGRKQNTLSSVKSSIEALPGNKSRVHTFVVDISNETKINDVFAEVVKNIGRVNIYVANAGCFPDPGKFAEVSIEELWRGFEINVKGLMIGARAFLKSAALSDAVFINLSTAAVHFKYFAPHVSYVSSKIAATRIIDYIAEENPHIRFYNMQPGLVLTEMAAKTQMDGTRITLDTGTYVMMNMHHGV